MAFGLGYWWKCDHNIMIREKMLVDMAILRSPTFMELPWCIKNIWSWDKIMLNNIMQLRRGTSALLAWLASLFIVSISSLIQLHFEFWYSLVTEPTYWIVSNLIVRRTNGTYPQTINRGYTLPFFSVCLEKAIYLWSINAFHPHKTFCILEMLRSNDTAETLLELYALATLKHLLTWWQICFLFVISTIATLKDRENITAMIFWKGLINFYESQK